MSWERTVPTVSTASWGVHLPQASVAESMQRMLPDLSFLQYKRLCSPALLKRLASRHSRAPLHVYQLGGPVSVPQPLFRHVALFLRPWLSARKRQALTCCGHGWQYWELFGNSPLSPPWPPVARRFRGFGVCSPLDCARHSVVAAWGQLHHGWLFLGWADHAALLTAAYPVALTPYAQLHQSALSCPVAISCTGYS